ncbi:hypothetical protein VRU48_13615 [Pedobacter sp. KR3-3]|uniref:YhhN-like protein n=1 Tax=Pedobacter albus TaxID=3113905 RepID=A0ABU7I9K3_9SPHI|nr:hypothetical protein [Pedobacter sp. KR3-3]MEE1946155.1 hypothetical protein [Pedobacter sp. KR3-3]
MSLIKFPFSLLAEWTCLIASILLLRHVMPKYWKLFIPYLALTVALESYSFFANRVLLLKIDTQWMYNLFLLVYLIFHLYIFCKIIELRFIRNIGLGALLILLTSYGWEWAQKGFFVFFSTTNILFSGVVIVLCVIYFYSLFQQEDYKNIFKDAAFWFVTGCLIFYAATVGLFAFFSKIAAPNQTNLVILRKIIISILNIIMYGCWIKSFLCLRRAQASLRQSS